MTQNSLFSTIRRGIATMALCAFVATATATWLSAGIADAGPTFSEASVPSTTAVGDRGPQAVAYNVDDKPAARKSKSKKTLTGKLNLNTATAPQLELLPGVPISHARHRLKLFDTDDASPRPLAAKLLERPLEQELKQRQQVRLQKRLGLRPLSSAPPSSSRRSSSSRLSLGPRQLREGVP